MKNVLKILSLIFVFSVRTQAAEVMKLEPDAILRFDFPDLPSTLATMNSGEKQPAQLTAQLPENYSPNGKFPLCVYLDGWDGGRGDRPGIARAIVGPTNFICVNLPLFKRAYSTNDGDLGLLITVDDFETVRRAYCTMLQKLFDAVPNITPERSAFGGFSNGAHATSLLLAGQDDFILHHFQAFYFVEGGAFLAANTLEKPSPSMKHFRFLFLHGDYSSGFLNGAIEECAKEQNLDFTTVLMPNTGHAFPPKYFAMTGQWIRGEMLPSPAQKK